MKQRSGKNENAVRRFIAAFCLLCLVLTTPAIDSMAEAAETVSGNSAKGEQESMESSAVTEEAGVDWESLSEDGIAGELLPDIQDSEYASSVPINPVHTHDGEDGSKDTTTWSYVYFGSYPQSEVEDNEIKSAIDAKIKSGRLESNGDGVDVWINGTKYRRISESDCNNSRFFHNVENNGYRYFKWERIKWKVLQVEKDTNTLFLAADQAMDCRNYREYLNGGIRWKNSLIRDWLNYIFYRMAFDSEEQEAIVGQTVVNEDNSTYGTGGCEDTEDNIYLLSFGEIKTKAYGFCWKSTLDSATRRIKTSDYAGAIGAEMRTDPGYEGNCVWWLRSPGCSGIEAAVVGNDGTGSQYGKYHTNDSCGVVPVLHISMSSDLWSMADDGASGSGGENDDGDYVFFGAWPRSEVTDDGLMSAIDGVIKEEGLTSDGEGIDVWIDGIKYRRISKDDCNSDEYFGDGNNGYRYFKWERMKWRLLQVKGGKLFLMADEAVDCKVYHDTDEQITWEACTLRRWLNENFYANAFNSKERKAVMPQTVGNHDYVSLLSLNEAQSREYGLYGEANAKVPARSLKASDYAGARGVHLYKDSWESIWAFKTGRCEWWLRTQESSGKYQRVASWGGSLNGSIGVNNAQTGVVPVLYLDASSELWSMIDDGTSGFGGEGGAEDPDDGDDGGNTGDDNGDDGGNTGDDSGNTGDDTGDDGGNAGDSVSGNGTQSGEDGTVSSDTMVSTITLTGISKKIAAGKKIRLSAEVLPINATDKGVTWTSSNPKYATVDANGVVTTKKAGAKKTVTITAAARDGSGVRAEYKIKIMKHAVKKVKITVSSKSVKAGKSLKLRATVTTTGKNANKKLKWTSSNDSYATVSSKGIVKALKAGKGKTVTITATATDGSGKKAKVKIKIK